MGCNGMEFVLTNCVPLNKHRMYHRTSAAQWALSIAVMLGAIFLNLFTSFLPLL